MLNAMRCSQANGKPRTHSAMLSSTAQHRHRLTEELDRYLNSAARLFHLRG